MSDSGEPDCSPMCINSCLLLSLLFMRLSRKLCCLTDYASASELSELSVSEAFSSCVLDYSFAVSITVSFDGRWSVWDEGRGCLVFCEC